MAEATISQIKVGNTTYDIHDAMWDSPPINLGPWEITGEGSINIHASNVSPSDETPSKSLYGPIISLYDSDNEHRTYFRHDDRADGKQGLLLETHRIVNGSHLFNHLQLHIDSSGNRSVMVSEAAPWRSALGLNADDTWHTGTFSSPFSNYSSESGNAPRYRKYGGLVSFYGIATLKSALDLDGSAALFTLPSGYRPTGATRYLGRMQGSTLNSWLLSVNISGAVQIARYGTATENTLSANVWLPFSGTFII